MVKEQGKGTPKPGAFECGFVALEDALAIAATVATEKEGHATKRSVLLAPKGGGFVVRATDLVTTAEVRFAAQAQAQAGTAAATGGPLLIDLAHLRGLLAAVRAIEPALKRMLRVRIEAVAPLEAKLVVGDFTADLTCFSAAHYPAAPAVLAEVAETSRVTLAAAVAAAAKVAKATRERSVLSCVSLAVGPGVVTVLGSTAGRLDVRRVAARTGRALGWEQHLVMEGRPLAVALRRAGGDDVVLGANEHGGASFTCGEVTLTSLPGGQRDYPLAQCRRALDVLPVACVVPGRRMLLRAVERARRLAEGPASRDLVEVRAGQEGVRVVPWREGHASESDSPHVSAAYEGPAGGLRRVFSGMRLEQALRAFDGDVVVLWLQRASAGLLLAECGRPPWDAGGHRRLLVGAVTAEASADARLRRAEFAAAQAGGLAPEADWPRARAGLEREARRVANPLLRDGRLTMSALLAACRAMYAGYDGLDDGIRGLALSQSRQLLAPGARSSTDPWSIVK